MKRGNGKGNGPGDYEVGYGRPPRHRQWSAGQSGNPKGRPKGAKSKHTQLIDLFDQPTRAIITEEMHRPITIRIGEEEVSMPMIQVITRAMAKSAAEGGQQAQRTALMLQLELERDFARLRDEALAAAKAFKARWGPEFAHCRAAGLPEPDIQPHPDDVYVDEDRMRIEIRGPRNRDQKEQFEQILALRDGHAEAFGKGRASCAANPRAWDIPIFTKREQECFDIINELLPERYRKTLEGRMTAGEIDAAVAHARWHLSLASSGSQCAVRERRRGSVSRGFSCASMACAGHAGRRSPNQR